MSAYAFRLPDLGEGLTEGEVVRWLVREGQEVAEDEPLVEIGTDKTTVEIPSPAAGRVARILVPEGEVVPVGTVLVVIGDGDLPPEPEPSNSLLQAAGGAGSASPSAGDGLLHGQERVRATPLVRRVAKELGVDLAAVAATGPQGRITEEDVRAAAVAPAGTGRREPIRGIRRHMFEHLTRSHREVAAVTWVEDCDFSGVDLKLLVPLVLQATAASLREFPELNARIEGDELVYADRFDIGVAVQTEQGLVVPVIRHCDSRSLEELDAEVRRLAQSAQAGKLAPEELRGGTFTVTSAGRAAGLLVTPLVNHPEVGILGVHRIEERAVVRYGRVVIRRMGNVSVTFDHRVVDGRRAAEFGLAVIGRLQTG